MEHQKELLLKENTVERKYISAWFSSFSLSNPWLDNSKESYFVKYIKDEKNDTKTSLGNHYKEKPLLKP